MAEIVFKLNTPLSVYRPVDKKLAESLRQYAWKCGLDTCAENFYLPVMSCDEPCNWHDNKPEMTCISVSVDGLKATKHGIGLKLKPYTFLNSCEKRYSSLPCQTYEPIVYLTRSTNTENINMHTVYPGKLILEAEKQCEVLLELKESTIEEMIPEDVDPDIWKYMTPAQKRLW